jgi:cytochrome c peroxidase
VERQGYALSKEKGCAARHNGPAAGGGSLQKFGIWKSFATSNSALGRIAVTPGPNDRMVFEVPVLL